MLRWGCVTLFGAVLWTTPPEPSRSVQSGRQLDALLGEFQGELRQSGATVPRVMTFSASWSIDSTWLQIRYHQDDGGRGVHGMLLISWDPSSETFLYVGFVNEPAVPTIMRGRSESARLVFESEPRPNLIIRESYETAGDSLTIVVSSSHAGSKWNTISRAVLRRVP